jgi:peptidyl-prolyl cis-trans isomerase SurA
MKKLIVPVLLFFIAALPALAQTGSQDPVLFTVNGQPVTRSEFLYVYQKNNPTKKNDFSRESMQEYLDLYVNFKLKVAEAQSLRIDTTRKVREELDKYGDQLIKSNFDKEVLEAAMQKHYSRMSTERLVYHVMISLDAKSAPEDSLFAYNRLQEAWEKVKNGADFATIAASYSTDPNAAANKGRVGWVTGFSIPDMNFEDMTYQTPVGGVSPVFLTKYGYHFIRVAEERAASGQVKVQHLLIKVPAGADATTEAKIKTRVDSVYQLVKAGGNFDELVAQYSEDKTTAPRKGELDWFGVGKMVAPFEEAAFALKNIGDVSEPVKTAFGYHIIRLQDKKGVGTYEEVRPDIKNRIERSSQYTDLRKTYVNKVKSTYTYKEYPENKAALIATLDSSFITNEWNADMAKGMNKPVFSIGDRVYTQDDLAITLQVKQRSFRDRDIAAKFDKIYSQANENILIEYDMAARNEDFRRLMQEYRDGIPLFALLEQKVWTAAAQDTAGLQAYYEAHKNEYMWDERVDASVFNCTDANVAKEVRKMLKKKTADSVILSSLNTDSTIVVTIERNKFLPGQNTNVDNMNKTPGIGADILNSSGNITFIQLHGVVPAQPKTLKEARGYVISDYQDLLEKEWIESLRAKYPVVINESVFNGMIQ